MIDGTFQTLLGSDWVHALFGSDWLKMIVDTPRVNFAGTAVEQRRKEASVMVVGAMVAFSSE